MGIFGCICEGRMKFNELVRLLENNGFEIVKEKGSIRYYAKPGWTITGTRRCPPVPVAPS